MKKLSEATLVDGEVNAGLSTRKMLYRMRTFANPEIHVSQSYPVDQWLYVPIKEAHVVANARKASETVSPDTFINPAIVIGMNKSTYAAGRSSETTRRMG